MRINNIKIKHVAMFLLVILVFFFLIKGNQKKPPREPSGYNISNDINRNTKPSTYIGNFKISGTPVAENDDWGFEQGRKEIYRKYPWYGKLPIENDEYGLVWVLEEESFRVILKISESKSTKEQKDSLVNKALEDIQEITGKSYKNYSYYVRYAEK